MSSSENSEKGERKILHAVSLTQKLVDDLVTDLRDGWVFDPWLNSHGRPIIVASDTNFSGFYWVLVKGSFEEITKLNPFIDITPDAPESEKSLDYVGLRTDYIPYGSDGKPTRDPDPGYVILDKGHIFAKGTVYTLLPTKEEETAE